MYIVHIFTYSSHSSRQKALFCSLEIFLVLAFDHSDLKSSCNGTFSLSLIWMQHMRVAHLCRFVYSKL